VSLLAKWRWRCLLENEELWQKIMQYKYDRLVLWLLSKNHSIIRDKVSLWWRDNVGLEKELDVESRWFNKVVKRKVGIDKEVRVKYDI